MSTDLPARMERAQELHRRGDVEGAIVELRQAVAIDARTTAAHKNLAALLWQAGRFAEARAALADAVTAVPGDANLLARLARAHADLGDAAAALSTLELARAAGPRDATTWGLLGGVLAEYGRWEESEGMMEHAFRLAPGDGELVVRLAHAKQETGDDAQALAVLAHGVSSNPASLNVAIDHELYLPQIYADMSDAARWRERYVAGLRRLQAAGDRWLQAPRQVFALNHHNFLLAYQGEDDLPLQRAYSRMLARLSGAARPDLRERRPATFDGGRRLRVGFASSFFRDCTAGRYFERWVTGLDPARFERFVYHTAPLTDDFTKRIAASVEHFAALRVGDENTADRIAADNLDVLVQPEVGMTPQSYVLAGLRLAPVQMAGWGHPVTTGSDEVDYYITCAAMEPAEAFAHYAERLVALPGLGVDYAMPREPSAAPRSALGLPEGKRLYVCPQSLFKVHPEMDALFARILGEDPDALLLLFQSPSRRVTERLAARLQRSLAAHGVPPRGQVKFLPRLSAENFRRALAAADVVLDTVRWSGGNTSLDALAAGTPIVTLPGRFMRARQTSAMLQMAGVGELIAGGVEDYVRIAVESARDRDKNAELRQRIRAGREALFERREPIVALEAALLQAATAGYTRS
ncbi:MAG TPA: tetratricopeptide repeat protein [Usitatibacter sp.]|nr:tetratricopeptide repeat protein [Usitatibacter sp.]